MIIDDVPEKIKVEFNKHSYIVGAFECIEQKLNTLPSGLAKIFVDTLVRGLEMGAANEKVINMARDYTYASTRVRF